MAGGAYQSDSDGAIADINVTPLVDVVLVLLVLFMVTAPMIAARGIMVDSPKTVSGDSVRGTLKITLTPDGVIYVDGQEFKTDQSVAIGAAIRKHAADNPEAKAIIAAGKTVPHGDVMEVIDLIKLAGISKFALSTARKVDGESEE